MAKTDTLIDTGPLVAYLNRRDEHHRWAVETSNRLVAPFLTCEAVLSETFHMMEEVPGGPKRLLALLDRNLIQVSFSYPQHAERIHELMRRGL